MKYLKMNVSKFKYEIKKKKINVNQMQNIKKILLIIN